MPMLATTPSSIADTIVVPAISSAEVARLDGGRSANSAVRTVTTNGKATARITSTHLTVIVETA